MSFYGACECVRLYGACLAHESTAKARCGCVGTQEWRIAIGDWAFGVFQTGWWANGLSWRAGCGGVDAVPPTPRGPQHFRGVWVGPGVCVCVCVCACVCAGQIPSLPFESASRPPQRKGGGAAVAVVVAAAAAIVTDGGGYRK